MHIRLQKTSREKKSRAGLGIKGGDQLGKTDGKAFSEGGRTGRDVEMGRAAFGLGRRR